MLSHNARPLIYAHRGSSADAPENTLAAFSLALEQGADGIELDAKLSADGEVVVIHDQTVDRTTQGKGRVNQHTLTQLRSLDAGRWKHPSFNGEKIPTLQEVFDLVGGKVIINIELTNYLSPGDGLAQKTLDLVRKFHLQDSVLFSSFLPANLAAVRALWSNAPVGILALRGCPGRFFRSSFSRTFSPEYLLPHFSDINEKFVLMKKKEGRRLNAWVINTPDAMRKIIGYGVAGIITDNPSLGLEIRGEA